MVFRQDARKYTTTGIDGFNTLSGASFNTEPSVPAADVPIPLSRHLWIDMPNGFGSHVCLEYYQLLLK